MVCIFILHCNDKQCNEQILQECPGVAGTLGMLVIVSVCCFVLGRQCLSSTWFELFSLKTAACC